MFVIKTKNDHFGECSCCKADWNSEMLFEYEFKFCPYCGEQREYPGVIEKEGENENINIRELI